MSAPPFPLTEAQEGIWYAQRLAPGNPIYNTGHYVEIEGPLDVAAFARAVDRAAAEAEALALRVIETADGPLQVIDPAQAPRLRVVDLTALPDPGAEARARIAADMASPLDPTRAPMAAEVLFLLRPGLVLWYQRIHHLAVDGYGAALLAGRIAGLYGEESGQEAAGPGFAPLGPVIDEDRAYRADPRRDRDRQFWRDLFARPAPDPGPATTAAHFHRAAALVPASLARALHDLAAANDLTWPDVLTALVAAYVARHGGGGTEVVLGVPFMGRMGSVAARAPAMVMNVLPVRFAVDEEAPLADVLVAAAKALRQARRHGRYRGEQVRRDLGLVGGGRRLHGPLVNILPFERPFALPGLACRSVTLGTGAVDDLTLTFRADPAGGAITLDVDANPDLFSAAETEAHRDRLLWFLDAAATAPRLAGVPSQTPAEAGRFVEQVNATDHPVPETTLTALIEAGFALDPAASALRFDGRDMSFADLDRASRALAGRLVGQGAGPGRVVAVMLPRSFDLVIALVAILRAGAAYLPLDPDHPPARIAAVVATAAPVLAVASPALAALVPDGVPVLGPDGGAAGDLPAAGPEDPAYVIFTSGSTGAPKGVVNLHRGIVNRLLWMRDHYGIGPADRILQKTPATFDVSVWEFFLPLIAGATLVIAPPGLHRDPAGLARLIRDEAVGTLHFVPSMLAVFLDEPAVAGLAPRRVFCSGEALPAPLRDRFHHLLPGVELHNLYGPTEAAVDVTFWPAGPDDDSRPVPIGFPVWNTALYILDGRLRPLPPGVAGDLYIAGRQVAAGYLGRADLTAERFLADPFRPGGRMYRTGDVARYRADGAIVYLGRSDHQVKIRGLRIELDEIEVHLARQPGVAQAAVITAPGAGGEAQIVGYAVPATVDPGLIRRRLADVLPDYMVPAAIVPLDALPLSANGKLDRGRLPLPVVAAAAGRPPETATEQAIAALFAEVLGGADVGAEDDFFALGGHSLLAARLALRLRARFGGEIGLGLVFERPTVARLAAWIEGEGGEGGHGLGPVITFGQGPGAPLFCLHPAGGIGWCYRELAAALAPARPVHAVQARGLDPAARLPDSLSAMAADYAGEIERLWPAGPCHLLGWSVGGIVAHEVAVQLRRQGREVGLVAMLDSYPAEVWRAEPPPAPGAALRALLYIAGHDPADLGAGPLTRDGVVGFLRAQGHALAALDDRALDGVIRVVEANDRLVRGHRHGHFDGPVLHFRAAQGEDGRVIDPDGWLPHVGRLVRHDLPLPHGLLTGAAAVARIVPLLFPQTVSSTMT
ncbi:non-ribosomal peptide synthetase [Zavarzinia compransoris]|uniref:Non-ribosomal peptide synthetase n=1 Tax=Zavarzinia compransoris TaxID=1264899 RepID=A0A317DTY3_9PROT|nr:non-ribosomal peptide synthetase [Zavarzinia compransoris]PWR17834.1 non-ribosomal peptide synthetase [Zavarzinia compransoris]TDP49368.1 enterobactin synthetase component F [Zavarzinia compransoris]